MPKHAAPERPQPPNCISCITLYPLGWRVMRCTCKGWVLTTHPCRHCITTALVKMHVRANP